MSDLQKNRASRLIARRSPDAKHGVWCLCIPHAGAGGHTSYKWQSLVAPHAGLGVVNLPGRGVRFKEAPYIAFDELLDDLVQAVGAFGGDRVVLFGHSLGAIIAYELARRLPDVTGVTPVHLFVSGIDAPHRSRSDRAGVAPGDHRLDDAELTQKLRELGGLPGAIIADPEALAMSLTFVRQDLLLYDSYVPPSDPAECQVNCPLTALGGDEDMRRDAVSALSEWQGYTKHPFRRFVLPGDHFFLDGNAPFVAHQINGACREMGARDVHELDGRAASVS